VTPGYAGLHQMNFQVPANAPDGDLSLAVSQLASQSNATTLPVHR
jgi:uncharacterized protein (TIGR03437 family)